MRISSVFESIAVCLLAISIGSGVSAPRAADPGPVEGETLSASEEVLLQSGVPVRVRIDEETGLALQVELLTRSELDVIAGFASGTREAKAAYPNACAAGRGCWRGVALPSGPPSQSIGFSVGVTTGSWNNRGDFWVPSGIKAKLCWASNHCTDRYYGPSVLIETGGNVVGTKVDLIRP